MILVLLMHNLLVILTGIGCRRLLSKQTAVPVTGRLTRKLRLILMCLEAVMIAVLAGLQPPTILKARVCENRCKWLLLTSNACKAGREWPRSNVHLVIGAGKKSMLSGRLCYYLSSVLTLLPLLRVGGKRRAVLMYNVG